MNTFRVMRFAVLGHRVSGLVLALFLPIHLAVFGQSLTSHAALDQSLALTALPWLKPVSCALVGLLIIHLCFGARVLLIEFGPVSSPARLRLGWIAGGLIAAVLLTIVYVCR